MLSSHLLPSHQATRPEPSGTGYQPGGCAAIVVAGGADGLDAALARKTISRMTPTMMATKKKRIKSSAPRRLNGNLPPVVAWTHGT